VPNIIVSLNTEMTRVRALLPRLDVMQRHQADLALRFAAMYMAMNDLGAMNEVLDDLRQLSADPKKQGKPAPEARG
jgi:hypothetical protein